MELRYLERDMVQGFTIEENKTTLNYAITRDRVEIMKIVKA